MVGDFLGRLGFQNDFNKTEKRMVPVLLHALQLTGIYLFPLTRLLGLGFNLAPFIMGSVPPFLLFLIYHRMDLIPEEIKQIINFNAWIIFYSFILFYVFRNFGGTIQNLISIYLNAEISNIILVQSSFLFIRWLWIVNILISVFSLILKGESRYFVIPYRFI